MSRRQVVQARETLPDPMYSSVVAEKFINRMMTRGKKMVARKILYDAMEAMREKVNEDPLPLFLKALDNVKPMVEVKSRRVGGSTYQVPVEVNDKRREALAMRWIIQAARARSGSSMASRLSSELLDAYNATGTAFKKKEDTHRMAEANKAFSHYRW
ncbi:MAG: 30S ribosomal protein S7 [Spirochaetales bacterium]|nr:30S ribosomal protein S7 [Spirochaetales bacterium]